MDGVRVVLAHQGGWDEAAILLAPVLVYLVVRYMGRNAPAPDDRPDDEADEGADVDADDLSDHDPPGSGG